MRRPASREAQMTMDNREVRRPRANRLRKLLRKGLEPHLDRLAPLIGAEAVQLNVSAARCALPPGGLFIAILGLIAWEEIGGGPGYVWALVAACTLAGLSSYARGIVLARRSADAASQYVSSALGYPVHLRERGLDPTRWRSEIDRVKASHEQGATMQTAHRNPEL
jgi:hypothetical protein